MFDGIRGPQLDSVPTGRTTSNRGAAPKEGLRMAKPLQRWEKDSSQVRVAVWYDYV